MEQKALKLIMAGLLILSMALTGREAAEYVGAMHAVNALRETGMGADDSGRLCVVVDAGHGGDDPGKIGDQWGTGKGYQPSDCSKTEKISGSGRCGSGADPGDGGRIV